MTRFFLSGLFLLVACGGTTTRAGVAEPGEPPPPPSADDAVAATPTTATYAIDQLFLGESARGFGEPRDTGAWRSFGFDLDHLVTTEHSTDVCLLSVAAPRSNQIDGDFGIDNSWGSTLLPILMSVSAPSLPTPSVTVSDAFAHGASTLDLEITGLPDDPAASALGLRARAFVVAATDGPAFDPGTARPVVASSVLDGATVDSGARVAFDQAYVSQGTFVSGPAGSPLVVRLPFVVPLELTIRDPVITFDRTTDPDALSGTIAGVLDTDALLASALVFAQAQYRPFCSDPSQFDGVALAIRRARDILDDATNHSGVSCTGISIGLGFHARRVANPMTVVADPPPAQPCK